MKQGRLAIYAFRVMKTLCVLGLLLMGVGCGRPVASTCDTLAGNFEAEIVMNCPSVEHNVALAWRALKQLGIQAPDPTTVYVREATFLGDDLSDGFTHFGLGGAWVELGREGKALAHELLHLHEGFPNKNHDGWKERGWLDAERKFAEIASPLEKH